MKLSLSSFPDWIILDWVHVLNIFLDSHYLFWAKLLEAEDHYIKAEKPKQPVLDMFQPYLGLLFGLVRGVDEGSNQLSPHSC